MGRHGRVESYNHDAQPTKVTSACFRFAVKWRTAAGKHNIHTMTHVEKYLLLGFGHKWPKRSRLSVG